MTGSTMGKTSQREDNYGIGRRPSSQPQPLPPELLLPRFVSVRELASRMGRNEFTVYHWLKKAPERLPRITRVHGRVLFLESDVQAWFEAQQHAITAQSEALRFDTIEQLPVPPRRGPPTKAQRVARREAAATGAAA